MSRYNHHHTLRLRHYLLRSLFIIVVVSLLGLFCPRDTSMKLHYQKGEPWEMNALIARDSFNIEKSTALLMRERDSLRRFYEPYYELRNEVKGEQLAAFSARMDSTESDVKLSAVQRHHVLQRMAECYETGILPDTSVASLDEHGVGFVHLFVDNEGRSISRDQLLSPQMAYEKIMQQDEDVRQFLLEAKIDRYLLPNLKYDEQKSLQQQREIDQRLTRFSGHVVVGEKIVDEGQIVTQAIYDKLTSYEKHESQRQKTPGERMSQLGGQVLFILLAVMALFIFFLQFRNDYLCSARHMVLVSLLVVIFPLIAYQVVRHDLFSVYAVPFCMVPVFVRVFMDSRTAFVTHLVCIMLCALAVEHPFEFVAIQTLAGLTAIYSLKQLQQRSELFVAVVLVIASSLLVHLCMDLIHQNFFNTTGIDVNTYISLACGGGLLLLSYLLLIPIEKLFRFTSTVTLVELSNINHPVLRRLSEEAPGTFNHSMQVANLAAEVANRLGAKTQLVRTAALYHDIGKLKNPAFFTENQGSVNPHDKLPFEESAQIIIQHVRYGLELASKHRLPQSIKDFIASHHGRSRAKFFYISYKNQYPDRQVNDEIFTYPGPNPASLEEAILMMADAVEAASRSLPEYTEDTVSQLVDRIVDGQVQEGYFNLCPITFENIATAKQIFKDKLKSIYHTRISYPELKH